MSEIAVRQVIERLEAIPPSIEGNREVLAWLRGERQVYDEAEERNRRVRLVDFERPAANSLHVELIAAPQLFNVTHLLEYWYGVTWNATRRFMARWKEEPEESYRFAVQTFFEPTDFLRTLERWILFYVEDGETRKSVLRQHQRIAIGKVVERCQDRAKTRGLIWHTQGSGKTFTLLTAARLILEDKQRFENATVLLVVDRIELEGQLKGWVERLLGEMQQQEIPVWRARSRDEVQELLRTDKRGLILSMIHKFEGIDRDANTRGNIYLFIDEAHRSVARDLGTYMMAAVPNATIIGFTGTPVARTAQGEGTFKIFGVDDERGYLDKYSIRESIEDETTLPLRHTMAPSEMTVPVERLDREFFELAEAEDVTDVDQLNRVLDRAVGLRTFLTADERIEKVASYVAQHFRENVLPLGYKAFLVGVNREACAKYKRALDRLLPAEWSEAVYTENAADVVDRPLVAELQLSPEREADVRLTFKKTGEEPKILIVTDKLLTGYDAPLLYCMYLDKIERARSEFLDDEGRGGEDERLERLVYGRFLTPESRKDFFEAYKEIEALWEILSPSPELRGHVDIFKRLAELYTVLRNAYEGPVRYEAALGRKTHDLVQDRVIQGSLGDLVRTVTFDVDTIEVLRGDPGSDEAKIFNLVRGLRAEIDSDPDSAALLRPLRERAEHILEDLENRNSTSLVALDQLSTLAEEKEEAARAARESGLAPRAFGVYWTLKDDRALKAAGISASELAQEAETLLARFPNAALNPDEQRRLRASLYRPLLGVERDERGRVVDAIIRKWGSCSTAGIVTLAIDLADQEPAFRDFVIAHELLHLRVPNHGKLFKTLMTLHVPGWRKYDVGRRPHPRTVNSRKKPQSP